MFKGSYRERARLRTGTGRPPVHQGLSGSKRRAGMRRSRTIQLQAEPKRRSYWLKIPGRALPQQISDEFVDEKFGEAILLGGIEFYTTQ
ncbi:hypothetical protein CEXT_771641 [Caerostris extrusa]|uniref:Uncharacterized protein n=1 Tax=Caerostris extrusa TaxID=172846 RepID=A0AAV4VQP1_CAEEX|nr:hypothetical protein CEXT_771641 [Caerostris extrusa]